jgi:hypothetical protein
VGTVNTLLTLKFVNCTREYITLQGIYCRKLISDYIP